MPKRTKPEDSPVMDEPAAENGTLPTVKIEKYTTSLRVVLTAEESGVLCGHESPVNAIWNRWEASCPLCCEIWERMLKNEASRYPH